ncbi:unnamed protein product [Fraxinus pennsylvanica]|uniref:Uncharacterized protein n=1 Tax=Fraxinus pennsylvanica TaxID=56036 RepID=A0AAD1YPC0_9LAMI|nr:unnamed protein product [Fraxinus pennsylvanica]
MESPVHYTDNIPPEDEENQEISSMADSVRAVEKLLNYNFKDKKLLEEALTHSSYTGSASYQRLEFVGDAALGLAITNYVFLAYPDADQGKLTLLRAANIIPFGGTVEETWPFMVPVNLTVSLRQTQSLIREAQNLNMKSPVHYTDNIPSEDEENQEISSMADSMRAVEKLLNYNFTDKKLLEEALTHSSYTGSASYQRLEFVGDAALGLAITNYVFLAYPDVDQGKLSLVRTANISTEKLARVAIRHGLYEYVHHNATALDEKVGVNSCLESVAQVPWAMTLPKNCSLELHYQVLIGDLNHLFHFEVYQNRVLFMVVLQVMEFAISIQEEDDAEVHGGLLKAPKVLADIVESVAAAVYIDCNFNLKDMWMVIRDLLEPIVTLGMLEQQPQPVTMLFELCQKDGKQVDIRHWRKGERNIASVYVDGHFVASASAEQKENARLHAAKASLQKLSYTSSDMMRPDIFSELNGEMEIEGAKQKLHELCGKKKWPRPDYKVDTEVGHSHEKKYVCSVQIEINESILLSTGNKKTRIRDAENSAASAMLRGLRESKYV